jgi:hypothetical protein
MRTLYFAVIGGFIGLLLYAGATGNFGIIPKLPFDLPFSRQVAPPRETLLAPMLLPDRSGTAGFNTMQMIQVLQQQGAKISWDLASDGRSWIMRYSMTNELTNEAVSGAVRLAFIADASAAGVHGRALVATAWVEDGEDLTLPEIYSTVLALRAAIWQGFSR